MKRSSSLIATVLTSVLLIGASGCGGGSSGASASSGSFLVGHARGMFDRNTGAVTVPGVVNAIMTGMTNPEPAASVGVNGS